MKLPVKSKRRNTINNELTPSVLKNLANSISSKEKSSRPNALKKLPSGTFSTSTNPEVDKEFFNLDLNEKSQQSLTRGMS
jgi:hypothetical protein